MILLVHLYIGVEVVVALLVKHHVVLEMVAMVEMVVAVELLFKEQVQVELEDLV